MRSALIALLLLPHFCWAVWHSDEQPIMGTRVHVALWSEDAERAGALLESAMIEMRRVDAAFSTHKSTSELSRLNRDAPHGWVTVSDELFELLSRARRVSEWSDGAFDVTYASVGRYYDFRAGKVPDAAELEAVKAIDYRLVEQDTGSRRVRYGHPRTYVDLGGIAKGHAVDRVAQMLIDAGVAHGSVTAGGDSRIIGDRNGKPWHIGVQDPRKEGAMVAILPLVDTAVSTSGDYERFFEADGVRYHHIIDPDTGDSARGALGVTVLGDDATLTDALATTIFVLGLEAGLEFANGIPGIDAIIIDPEGGMHFTEGLADLNGAG